MVVTPLTSMAASTPLPHLPRIHMVLQQCLEVTMVFPCLPHFRLLQLFAFSPVCLVVVVMVLMVVVVVVAFPLEWTLPLHLTWATIHHHLLHHLIIIA